MNEPARPRRAALVPAAVAIGTLLVAMAAPRQEAPGYTDTPLLPDGKWHVHDSRRPQPPVVAPAAADAASFARPPADAIVLFDGRDLSKWRGSDGGPAKWKVIDGCFEVNGGGDVETVDAFGDCQLHLEWCEPTPPSGDSQGRGNSGLFLMQRYEVQILDCFQNRTYPDGQTGALYGQWPPQVNACRPPGEWQSYDIVFEAPRFDGDRVAAPARVTVIHNGVVLHHAKELLGATAHREVAAYAPHAAALPIRLQDHGNPVRFRNVWVRPLRPYDAERASR